MKLNLLAGFLGSVCFGTAMAQQSAPSPAQVQLPAVQVAGNRPGGISFVTRRNGTVGNILAANSLWTAGGVPVVASTGASGGVIGSATYGVASASRPVSSPATLSAHDCPPAAGRSRGCQRKTSFSGSWVFAEVTGSKFWLRGLRKNEQPSVCPVALALSDFDFPFPGRS